MHLQTVLSGAALFVSDILVRRKHQVLSSVWREGEINVPPCVLVVSGSEGHLRLL